jgi:hypothetical protein
MLSLRLSQSGSMEDKAGAKHSSKARMKQNFLDHLSNSGPAVRLYGEGGAIGPPESDSRVIRDAKNSQNRVSIPGHPVRLVSGAAPRDRAHEMGHSQHFRPSAVQVLI